MSISPCVIFLRYGSCAYRMMAPVERWLQGNINGMMGESSARFRQFHDAARTATMRDASGIGLADIEERARALGGTAVCGPYHEGWRVFVSIPKTDDDAAASATTKENV